MATRYATLKDSNGDTIYPQSVIAQVANGEITTGLLANGAVTSAKIDWSTVIDKIYPVGSIYMSVNSTSPATFIGGTWERIQDTFLLGAGSTYAAGSTGGSATHKHRTPFIASHGSTDTALRLNMSLSSEWNYDQAAISNTPRYTNAGNVSWGGNDIIYTSNTSTLPPYLAVYVWKRTA